MLHQDGNFKISYTLKYLNYLISNTEFIINETNFENIESDIQTVISSDLINYNINNIINDNSLNNDHNKQTTFVKKAQHDIKKINHLGRIIRNDILKEITY